MTKPPREFILTGNYWADKGAPGTEDWLVLHEVIEKSAYDELNYELSERSQALVNLRSDWLEAMNKLDKLKSAALKLVERLEELEWLRSNTNTMSLVDLCMTIGLDEALAEWRKGMGE